MTVVPEFYVNAAENTSTLVVFVSGKEVRYEAGMTNQHFHLQYTPYGPNKLDVLIESANMEEIIT